MRLLDAPRARRSPAAFTLVELLVVIGIIAVLISVLLPALNKARQTSTVTKCLSNMRQLAMAVNAYVTENRGTVPEAMYNNKGGLSPRAKGLPAWSATTHMGPNLPAVNTYVWPSIGEALAPQLGKSDGVWQCPNGANDYNAIDPYETGGDNPYSGTAAPDVWLPNYFYMGTKFYASFAGSVPSISGRTQAGFNGTATDWTVRNVAGLRATKLRSVKGEGSSEIVVFCEYKSTFHTKSKSDVYAVVAPDKTEYLGNYAFLDGHAETRKYTNRESYMAQVHQPIMQSWYGRDFASHYAEYYKPENWLKR
jgi:prepilin-type N-terminal cleavage/methylation domain-containing protein/prepilin-type processing-associated H-X9-DG protein